MSTTKLTQSALERGWTYYGLPFSLLHRDRTCPHLSASLECWIPSVQNDHHYLPSSPPCSLEEEQCFQESLFHLSLEPFPAGQSATGQTPAWIPVPLCGASEELDHAAPENKEATGYLPLLLRYLFDHLLSGETPGGLGSHGHPVTVQHIHKVRLFLSPRPLGHSLGSPCP